jgi:enterobacteria phage integrase
MRFEMAKIEMDYVDQYLDRHGKMRRYFRRGGKRLGPLPGIPGSAEFMAAYQAYLNDEKKPKSIVRPMHEDSLAQLIADFYAHSWFTTKKPSTKKIYRDILDGIAREHGHRSVADMTAEHAETIIARIGEQHGAMANLTCAVMRRLMHLAVKLKRRSDNPFAGIESSKTGSHHTWTDDELKRYEARWPLGSRERLAYALSLYSGQRVGDVARMNRSDISDGAIHVIQQKTGAEVWIPIHPELARVMKAYPAKGLSLIGDINGRQLTAKGLGRAMSRAIKAAGLPKRCVAHGLRKAHLRLVAEAGGTVKELQATGGHKSLDEVQRYTEAADKKRLARAAIRKMRVPNLD